MVLDLREAHGVEIAPSLGRVHVTATGTNEVAMVDATTFHIAARAPAGDFPDGLAFAPKPARSSSLICAAREIRSSTPGRARSPDTSSWAVTSAIANTIRQPDGCRRGWRRRQPPRCDRSGDQPSPSQPGTRRAHSVAVDPITHHVYLPLPNVNGIPYSGNSRRNDRPI